MKFVFVLLAFVASTSAQGLNSINWFRRPSGVHPTSETPARRSLQPGQVDAQYDTSEYHFSWLHDGNERYTGDQVEEYCLGLDGGWQPISIETTGENIFVTRIIQRKSLSYIWSGATRSGRSFRVFDWVHTGGCRRRQHDVACRYPKPVICERRA